MLMRELEVVLSRVAGAQSTPAAETTEVNGVQDRTGSRLESVGDSGLESEAAAESDVLVVEPRKSLLMDNIESWGQSVHSATAPLNRTPSGISVCSKITDDEDLNRGASLSLASFYSAHTEVTDFADCIDHGDVFSHGVEIESSAVVEASA